MWKLPLGMLAVAGFVFIVYWGLQQSEVSRSLPNDIILANMQGEEIPLSDFSGQPVIVNFWATWCPPCIREMPLLARYAEKEGFALVLINQAESVATIQAYLDEAGLEFEHMLLDSHQRLTKRCRLEDCRQRNFFNADGGLVNEHLGELHDRHLDAFIQQQVN
ncbi:MAG: TlpA family protein disulfide reductase [Nitrincola sp.]|nr:TlpA family protein disulfide reductase [Nitrincola sp.]